MENTQSITPLKEDLAKNINPTPLTLEEIDEAARQRVSLINKEFTAGFDFLKSFPKSVTFFGSARFEEGNPYYEKARNLAKKIVSELGYAIVSGGGPGIMEAANKGALEAGGESVGLNIDLPHEQTTNPFTTKSLNFYYFFTRKVCLTFSAETFIFFPGGFGTMDELTELTTLMQTKKIPTTPIILVGKDFWDEYNDFVKNSLLKRSAIDASDIDLYKITDDENEILEIIKNSPVRNGLRYTHNSK